jgi:hypothetical protein
LAITPQVRALPPKFPSVAPKPERLSTEFSRTLPSTSTRRPLPKPQPRLSTPTQPSSYSILPLGRAPGIAAASVPAAMPLRSASESCSQFQPAPAPM